MRTRHLPLTLVLLLLFTACNLPVGTDGPGGRYQDCYFNWATRPEPELSAQVEEALLAAGLPVATASAEAYGENCYSNATNKVVYFAAMETDFHISLVVEGLGDRSVMGNLLEATLTVLDDFPSGATPGPQPGYIGVNFQSGDEELRLWFTVTDSESARARGLTGAALLDELENK
jgi:hypothetical protein